MLRDSVRANHTVGGVDTVTVEAPSTPTPSTPTPSATRSFNPASVAPGGRVTVTIQVANYGGVGRVTETLPAGFAYVSSTHDSAGVNVIGQEVRFTLQGDSSVAYTVTASTTAGPHSFSGVFRGVDVNTDPFVGVQVVGDSNIMVAATTPLPGGPNASRSLSADSVTAGGQVTVMITADGYGSFGDVAETLPAGFTYVSSDLPDDQVTEEGQTVRFALLGGTPPTTFTYTVTASSVRGDYSFMGVFSGVDANTDPFVGVQVVGDSNIMVAATTPLPGGPNASRSLSADSVAAGGQVTVTITADGYGSFGDVAETLPAGFTYVSSDLPDDQVTDEGQTVKFALLGGTPPTTFTYTVTASSVRGDYSFMGVFSGVDANTDPFVGVQVVGDSNIMVAATTPLPGGPNASRSLSADSVAAGGQVTVMITADGYGSFGDVAETLPAGFTYVSSDLPDDQVTEEGQTVRFALLGGTPPTTFTYTVTASSVRGDYSFMGVFSGVDANTDPFVGVQVVGDADITTVGPNASRSLSADSVAAGGQVTVTITADGYGSFGDVAETLPAGFTYVSSDLPDDQVTEEGQTIRFALLGGTPPTTFTYTVTASSVRGDYSFMGVFSGVDANTDPFVGVQVVGDSNIMVIRASIPPAPRPIGPSIPAPVPSPSSPTSNRAPSFAEGGMASRSVAEASASGTNVGEPVAAYDSDNDSVAYTLIGAGADSFAIDRKTGQITVGAGTDLDYETKDTYSVRARVTDSSNAASEIEVTISVINVDEAGTVSLSSMEPQAGTALTATLTDLDGSISGVAWSWAKSSDRSAWTNISGATSATYTPVASDGESYLRATATYTDGEGSGKTAEAASANAVHVPNTAPSFPTTESGTRSVAENTPSGEDVGDPAMATDADDDPLTYTLSGADADSFEVGALNGQLKTKAALDYETRTSYGVTVMVSDGRGGSDSVAVIIAVTDVDETPPPTATPAPTPRPTATPAPTPEPTAMVPEATPTPRPTAMVPEATPTPEPTAMVPEATPTPEPTIAPVTPPEEGGGFPGWAIALIVVVVVGGLLIGGFAFIRARRGY